MIEKEAELYSQIIVQEHWEYVEKTLLMHGADPKELKLIRYHYTSAMTHGFKHGVEFMKGLRNGN